MIIKRRSLPGIPSKDTSFRHLRGCLMAAASNFIVGQADFHASSLRGISSNISTSSAIDVGRASGRFLANGFRLKGCLDEYGSVLRSGGEVRKDGGWGGGGGVGGVQKARAYAPCFPQLMRVSEEVVGVEEVVRVEGVGCRGVNGNGAPNRGNASGFLDRGLPEKVMVAVDVDEVLGNFVSALNKFIAERYSENHSVSDYHVYEFFKIWNCSRDEADIRVHEFFKTSHFKEGIYPLPGARDALKKLSESCHLSIVTSRQNAIKDHTIEWIERHFPDLFQEIHFGNHFALSGQSRPKSEICKSLGAKVLIDDNPRYAIECAEVGIKVLLFDYENSYPWSKSDHICQHPLVTKVRNWEEVEHRLASCIFS